jgi:NUMOD3 motif
MHYYTYAYLREDKTPYYIGKGKGDRINSKQRNIKKPKDKSRVIYLKQNLTEEEAFKHEIYMIAVLGRKDLGTGILHNRTDGGEGSSGWVPSEETKRKLSEAHKGNTYCLGKTHSDETKRKLSEIHKGKTLSKEHRRKLSEAHKGKNHYLYGKSHSEETRKKISDASKGRIFSKETKIKMSEAKKNISEETRRKMSEAHKGKTASEETRRKMSEAHKGTKWWNDGCGNRKMMIECPGDGWRAGIK